MHSHIEWTKNKSFTLNRNRVFLYLFTFICYYTRDEQFNCYISLITSCFFVKFVFTCIMDGHLSNMPKVQNVQVLLTLFYLSVTGGLHVKYCLNCQNLLKLVRLLFCDVKFKIWKIWINGHKAVSKPNFWCKRSYEERQKSKDFFFCA